MSAREHGHGNPAVHSGGNEQGSRTANRHGTGNPQVKILAVGDIHLGRTPSRLPEELNARDLGPAEAWRRTVVAAVDDGMTAVLLAGDVVDRDDDFFEAYRALERSGAVSATYIDRTTDLAARVGGDGEALVQALRSGELGRFRRHKIDELEQWLAEEGFIDDQERLTGEDRRRLTVQRAAPATPADATDVNRVVSWMEANAADDERGGDR